MGNELATTGGGLALLGVTREKAEALAAVMAREFEAATADMRVCLKGLEEAADRLEGAFGVAKGDHVASYNRFRLDIKYDDSTVYGRFRGDDGDDPYKDVFRAMRRNAWVILINHLGVKNIMSVKRREQLEKDLKDGEPPEITEATILGTVLGFVGQADEFAKEAAAEVFKILRPATGGRGAEYKTNSAFRVGRRVVLNWWCQLGYGHDRWRVNYNREAEVIAVDGVFHLLDGKGALKTDRRSPLVEAIRAAGADGKGETEFFRFRCFKNGNVHLEFKRVDLVKQLNGLGTGEFVLGAD